MPQHYPYEHITRVEVAPFLPPVRASTVFLEIGCGYGNFRGNVSRDCDYWGIEPSATVAQLAAQQLDRVLTGTFEQVFDNLPDHHFDCVICNDVIEHMDDVDGFLRVIQTKLKPGGVLVGSIPNVRYIDNLTNLLLRKDWHYVDSGILDRTHLRFFTQKSLLRTFAANGYTVEQFAGLNAVGLKTGSLTRLLLSCAAQCCSLVLGRDTLYTQFGFRVRPTLAPDHAAP